MRLYSFQIKGFRSIIDTGECKISEIDNIVVMAGQNEAGKTAVLEALDFFRNGPSESFVKYQKRLGCDRTEVLCKFVLEAEDLHFSDDIVGKDKIDKYVKNNKYISFVRESIKEQAENIKITDESSLLLKPLFPEAMVEPPKTEVDPTTNPSSASSTPPTSEELFDNTISKLVESIPPFSLYTTFSDLLPSEILVTDLGQSNAVKDFEKVFSVNLAEYAQVTDPRDRKIKLEALESLATDDFNQSWKQTISSVKDEKKYTFSIEIDNAEPKKIIFMIKGKDGTPLYLEQKSMGFRWFSAFHLRLRSLMKDSTSQVNGLQQKNARFVVLIDEPGQNLHDIAQKDVKKILEETAGKNIQIIYSTHNPNLIGTEGKEFTRIRLVSNDEKLGTKVENVAQFISKEGKGSLDALSPIRMAMGLINVQSIFDPNKFNVVVEGITDHYYLSAFKLLLKKDDRLHFIPACGVDNVKHLVSVMIGWGCNYKAVFDDDPSQGRKAYNQLKKQFYEDDDNQAHNHILKIADCYGIEDTFGQTDFENIIIERKRTKAEKKMKNSEVVKESGKEMYARMFLEKAENGDKITLSKATSDKIERVFKWIYEKFGIQ